MTDKERPAPDLRALENDYDIRGELRGTDEARYFIARTKDERAAEVAIGLVQAPKGGENNALSHFASDIPILQSTTHPALARVYEGRWLGNDTFAVVTERVQGDTLDELLERGEKFSNPHTALVLQQVSSVLDWARSAGVVHRGVTPETLWFERDGSRVRLSFVPTPIPMSGVPDASSDARTLAMLAWAFLTGARYQPDETRSLGEVSPNLATRVVEAVDKVLRTKDHAEAPDISTFLGILAAGDVLKQAEVEMAATKEEYDEQHRAELQKCEIQRQEVELNAAEQAAMLAGEREEFERKMADERAAIEAERAQVEALMNERKDRLAAVRAELDEQRTELERRLAELEQYRVEVEKVRDDAIAAREAAKEASARAAEAAAAHAAALKAASLTPPDGNGAKVAAVTGAAALPPAPAFEPHKAPKLAKPPKAPKWDKIERVDLEHTDNVTVPAGRPRWMIPAGVATLALILVAAVYGMMNREPSANGSIKLGKTTIVPTAPAAQRGGVPRGGFLTQSAGGALAPRFGGAATPMTARDSVVADSTARAAAAQPPVMAQAQKDSAYAAAARRARAAARAEAARRRPTQAEIDSMNTPPGFWSRTPRPDTSRRDSIRPPDSLPARDVMARVDTLLRRDTLARRDSTRPRPDTARPRPDTGSVRR